ncbi:MAG: hypothetical protein EZS28_024326 [Streblomastix strix]|uniref:Uncharacterized protein n=1 Tax=Streblomastix strix TaxID=222440 RepID=A0A5J4VC48_9EUKA|nr:MAG: hypothetical protein EZS28_024326 [Streblomastix strix]
MECNQKTAKFFIGEKLNEEVELGVSKLPPDIQVVYLAEGLLKAYKSHNTERNGQGITKLVEQVGFGLIADGDEIYNNIPIPEKDFRAITYDEKESIIRFGWHEVFRRIPTKDEQRITFDVDL